MPVPADAEVRSLVARASTYLKAHEILIIAVLSLGLIWFVSGKVQDVIAAHDAKNLTLGKAALAAQVEKNTALAQQVATQTAANAAQKQETDRLNASLEQANAALIGALARQQTTDRQLPPTELAQRIETLAGLPAQSVVPQPNASFSLSQPAAVQIAVTLETVPALQKELTNAQQEKLNTDALLTSTQGLVGTLNSRVDGLGLQLVAADKVCTEQIKVVKDAAAKSQRKWMIISAIFGFVARQVLSTPIK